MHHLRKASRWSAAVLGAAMLIGCADGPTSPVAVAAPNGASNLIALDAGVVGTTVFTVGPSGGRFALAGGHVVKFDAYAICTPGISGYGPSMWDAPCRPSTMPITFTAVSRIDENGYARVDFSPDVRFVPTSSAPSRVLLQLKDKAAVREDAIVVYCPSFGSCVDESASDASLKSKRDSRGTWVYRYIKHFSGYNVSTGRSFTADESLGEEAAVYE